MRNDFSGLLASLAVAAGLALAPVAEAGLAAVLAGAAA